MIGETLPVKVAGRSVFAAFEPSAVLLADFAQIAAQHFVLLLIADTTSWSNDSNSECITPGSRLLRIDVDRAWLARRVFRMVLLCTIASSSACAPAPTPALPPATGLALTALTSRTIAWDSTTSSGVTTYVQLGSYPAAHARELHDRAVDAVQHALRTLDEPKFPPHLRVFHVGSRDDVEAITGVRHAGTADVAAHTVLLVANESWRPFTRHEVMHAVSLSLWGHPEGAPSAPANDGELATWRRGGWLREGLGAAAENRCGRYTNRSVAAAALAEGKIIDLPTLMSSFYTQDDLMAYLQAGSLVEYLLATHGIAAFRSLWRSGSFERALGESPTAVETSWRAWLEETPASDRPATIQSLRDQGCG